MYCSAVANEVETWLTLFVSVSAIVLYDGWSSANHVTTVIQPRNNTVLWG